MRMPNIIKKTARGLWNEFVADLILLALIFLYPLHGALRTAARLLLLICTVGPLLVPLCLAIVGWTSAWSLLENQDDGTSSHALIGLLALLSSLGLLANFLKRQWTTICESLWQILSRTLSIIVDGEWMPGLDIKKSLRDTWGENLSFLWRNLRDMSVASWRFVIAASLFLPVCLALYFPVSEFNEWRDKVLEKVERPSPVIVIDTVENVQYVFEKDKTFVLAHVEDADLESRAGICLDDGQQRWLAEFKKAIEQCADSGPRPELEVRAFSSTAPMALGGRVTPHGSASANCEVANQRAEAVVEFLLGRPRERWACGSGGRVAVGSFENGGGQLCQRSDSNGKAVEEFTYGDADGLNFDLSYKPWGSHAAMTAEKPADNGVLPGPRRYNAEFLNRAVYVTLKNDVCKKTEN